MYIKQHIKCTERKDLKVSFYDQNNEFQSYWIEIYNKNSSNIIVGVFYRHPKKLSNTSFSDNLNKTLDTIKNENKTIVITGDFNYDLLKIDHEPYAKQFIETLYNYQYQPCILEPTRIINGNRPSLIDNIFLNTIDNNVVSGNITSPISDHLPNFLVLNNASDRIKLAKKEARNYSKFDQEAYNRDVEQIQLLQDIDIDKAFDDFQDKFTNIINKHAPMKFLSKNELKWKQKPWINRHIQSLIKEKNRAYRKYISTKKTFWFEKFKALRNLIKKDIFKAKKNYYKKYFQQHQHDSKKVWKGISNLINKNKKSDSEDIYLTDDGKTYTDQKEVAQKFNKFYTTVASKLVAKLGEGNNVYQDYLKNPNKHSIFMNEIEPDEVRDILQKLDITKSSDIFNVSPRLVKTCATQISNNLTKLFNTSLAQGKFPSKLKTTKVIPIFKADSKMEVGNYRPISLLPILGKVFEKLVHSRLYSFFEKNKIINDCQYGFQKNKSTEQALIDIQSKIIDAFERKETPCCIFLDFAKAFDTVNHNILLHKLEYYGIRGTQLQWIRSYLTNREQCVQVGNKRSTFLQITCGVPQGSVLGPLLFLIYINDIVKSSKILKFQLFADDTCLFYSHRDTKTIESTVNSELTLIYDWLLANKLSLNVKKSNVLTFRNKSQTDQMMLNLKINEQPIEEKISAKYLGILFDNKLTWIHHIDHISKKLIKSNGLLAKVRHFLPHEKTKAVYNAIIQPHIDYGCLSWSSAAPSNIEKLAKLQRKAIRIINFKTKHDETNTLFKNDGILPLQDCINFNKSKFFWKYIHNKIPESLSRVIKTHKITTIQQDTLKLLLPYHRTSLGTSFLFYSGVKTWNTLPLAIKCSKSIQIFKNAIKKFYLHNI